jgi:hypothetical protein
MYIYLLLDSCSQLTLLITITKALEELTLTNKLFYLYRRKISRNNPYCYYHQLEYAVLLPYNNKKFYSSRKQPRQLLAASYYKLLAKIDHPLF